MSMLRFDKETAQFAPYMLRITIVSRDESMIKYDDSMEYWENFERRWWHTRVVAKENVKLSDDQKSRLDEVNAHSAENPNAFEYSSYEVSEYVESGGVSPRTYDEYLKAKLEQEDAQDYIDRFLEAQRQGLRKRLADYRYLVEIRGIKLADGRGLCTEREARSLVLGAHHSLVAGLATQGDFKTLDGWETVTSAEEMEQFARPIVLHTQRCFSAERQVSDHLASMDDYRYLEVYYTNQAFINALAEHTGEDDSYTVIEQLNCEVGDDPQGEIFDDMMDGTTG